MVEIESTEKASRASNSDPTASVYDAFYNACDVAPSRRLIGDRTAVT